MHRVVDFVLGEVHLLVSRNQNLQSGSPELVHGTFHGTFSFQLLIVHLFLDVLNVGLCIEVRFSPASNLESCNGRC